jgi:leucyl-tRNA synthetase
MDYNFPQIESKWQNEWRKRGTYKVTEQSNKPKYYVLDMFPYPSGAGLHVGHPLGYIASDIFARYKRHQGFNVLHPMGYDSFGLPAEQYAIQTGHHPAITTEKNIARYREQLDKIGFSYDWDREVRTSDPEYYKWTQWIFGLIFNSWFNLDTQRAEHINALVEKFATNGNYNVNASIDEEWHKNVDRTKFPFFSPTWEGDFSATDWNSMTHEQQQLILMHYRLTFLADSVVNWCPALGTVLANDEIKDGVSERGGFPVEQKLMRQWSMRISAYAERLIGGLENLDWSESIKEVQRNWIGRSEGASIRFEVANHSHQIEVFTTRPDTIFGVSFMTLAPEHPLVAEITTPEYRDAVEEYIAKAKLKTERDRQSDVKNVSGQFTGAHVVHPFTGNLIPVWIGEYVLAGYGTGAVMAVPCGDQRDWDFAKKFNLPIPNILDGIDVSEKADPSKETKLRNSDFLNGLSYKEATRKVIDELEKLGIGKGKVNYRLRDAVFSRQRYWGEPFPIVYSGEIPQLLPHEQLPVVLPEVDKYLPTEDGEPPLARAKNWVYKASPLTPLQKRGEQSHHGDTIVQDTPLLWRGAGGEASNLEADDEPMSVAETEIDYGLKSEWQRWQTANPEKWAVLKVYGRDLRKNATETERVLWFHVRNRRLNGYKFRRQHAIGNFIVDFVCLESKLCIELDGGYHDLKDVAEYDALRQTCLESMGFKVLRFKNEEVSSNIDAVLSSIKSELEPSVDFKFELNTMPGWAGSSWYFLRYMDAKNISAFASRDKVDYWGQVDLYMGGAEHATGHLLYARFWTKVLYDLGYIGFDEPFQKMINQGMIQGRSSFVYRIKDTNKFVSFEKHKEYETSRLHADISMVDNDVLDIEAFKAWRAEFADAEFILNDQGKYVCGTEVEKMSKSKYNVQTPDELVEKFGADTLRCYEMFLGPVEQHKPWDTKGINGVHNFLRKLWRLFHDQDNNLVVSNDEPTKAEWRTLHKTIKKTTEDLNRFSWNTVVSNLMICVNELQEQKCNKRAVLEPLCVLLSPYAPHTAEELWQQLGHSESVTEAIWPAYDEKMLQDDDFEYPVSFNGKTRFFIPLPVALSQEEVTKAVMAHEQTAKYLEGKEPKKIIVVPKRIVNVVM